LVFFVDHLNTVIFIVRNFFSILTKMR